MISCQSDHSWINWKTFLQTLEFESTLTLTRIGDPTVLWHVRLSWESDQIRHVRKSVPELHNIWESDHSRHIRRSVPGFHFYIKWMTDPSTLFWRRIQGPLPTIYEWHIRRSVPRSHSLCSIHIKENDHSWHIWWSDQGSLFLLWTSEWSVLTHPERSPRITLYSVQVINPDISGEKPQDHFLQCTSDQS